jgi:hypothetical protein
MLLDTFRGFVFNSKYIGLSFFFCSKPLPVVSATEPYFVDVRSHIGIDVGIALLPLTIRKFLFGGLLAACSS